MNTSLITKRLRGFSARAMVGLVVALVVSLLVIVPAIGANSQEFYTKGSLPEIAKSINQIIYPTFGQPAIVPRGNPLTVEWDWRLSDGTIPLSSLPALGSRANWKVWITNSIAANVQHYDGSSNDPNQWYNYVNKAHPYGYGAYSNPVETVANSYDLKVRSVDQSATAHWPEVFGQSGYVVDKITATVPGDVPMDLYDVHVQYKGTVPSGYKSLIPSERVASCGVDSQPHALDVISQYKKDIKVVEINDVHVFGQEIQSWTGMDFNSFVLREPRPGTPSRGQLLGASKIPLDNNGDGVTNEGAVYLQEELQAINLINPDFVVFSGDALFAQKNFATYPSGSGPFGASSGQVGTEYRFEDPWFYDEMLALNVPVFMVPGNHDGYNWDGHVVAHDDGQEIWQDLFGPLYYSWDYGNYHFMGINTMDWSKSDRNGFSIFGYINYPYKWQGQVRGGGDTWQTGTPPAGSGLLWDPGNPANYTGQLAWIASDLAANRSKQLRGAFMHHDPFENIGSPPIAYTNGQFFGITLPGTGEGQGSQSLAYLLRSNDVAFESSGHIHSDWVGKVRWYDGKGQTICLNTVASEIPVKDGESSTNYAGYRMISIDNGQVTDWGLPGGNNDPNHTYSIPGWANINVGNGLQNGSATYYDNRPSIQWMEEKNTSYRPPVTGVGMTGVGTFTSPELPGQVALPLNNPDGTARFDDVTCTIKNTLDGTHGALLNLTGCRIEFVLKKTGPGSHYVADNGRILEQYNTAGAHVVVVLADAPGGATVPVHVHAVASAR